MLLENERNCGLGMDALVSSCLEHKRNYGLGMDALMTDALGKRNYGLGMDALLVGVCSWNTNGVTVWAWMLCWLTYALGTRAGLWFGHGCSGERMILEHKRNYGLSMDALLVGVCSWNTNGIMAWTWMLCWLAYALGTQTELRFGHGCFSVCSC